MKRVWLDLWEREGDELRGVDRYRRRRVVLTVERDRFWQTCWFRSHDRRCFYCYVDARGQRYVLGRPGRGFVT